MAIPQSEPRLRLPSSIKLLLAPGMRIHTGVFAVITLFLVVTGFVGKAASFSETWTMIFIAGASLAFTYLVVAPMLLSGTVRRYLLLSKAKARIILVALVYAPILAGLAYWTSQAGSVEALPIFPAFLVIFHVWILLQAYFVAAPVTHALSKIEESLSGEKFAKRVIRTLGIGVLFLPVVPLGYGVWTISSWLGVSSQSVQLWTVGMIIGLLITLFLTLSWTWPAIRRGKPQVAVFAGGTYAVVWAYLLYRSTTMLVSYLNQSQASNAFLDIGLMIVSIFGAMQTFARKTMGKRDRRWSEMFPFLVFSFGAIYAVAQLYFIVQIPITRADLSILVNATIFASGLVTMMFLIRRHVFAASPSLQIVTAKASEQDQLAPESTAPASRLSFLLGGPKSKQDKIPPDDDY